ncbi:L-asparaginase, type II [Klebsiella pneumoniae]|uniref:fructose-asparagine asparaginase n=1 Tax=Klebsiella pneumoniae TaxID=573 RepID=UPI0006C26251|nr:fructose-asparagine asparaginase [Klebsiella pneumoniae]MDG3491766.1 fructose-asparagine asparaginase [Klebsiella pneumoniae]MDQ4648364.1 fructose-asparagine asparaginase [Klebsiella pneumoniae]OLL06730.1 L-asparaginase precursor [Klebsiella pneumoniae subsp. pneumoniae]TXU20668.1 type II asparaginase [Klebsiella pneumoniae]CTQ27559.1 L-asparaginase [Klebsiella pneumoniae]
MNFRALLAIALLTMSSLAFSETRLPHIVILATGGTIAGSAASNTQTTGYKAGAIGVQTLINAVPEMSKIAHVEGEQVANIGSENMTSDIILQLSKRVNALLARDDVDVDGVVITHGTDTLDETPYFLNLTVKSNKPVVFTAAMRPATAISADGPMNLLEAVTVAADPDARGRGVMVVLNDRIGAARFVTKTNATSLDTFRAPEEGYLGVVVGGKPQFETRVDKIHTLRSVFDVRQLKVLPKVVIIYGYQDDPEYMYDAAIAHHADGIIYAGTGAGSVSVRSAAGIKKAQQAGIVVVRASRTGSGVVPPDDSQPGLVADSLNPAKARILLMTALTQTKDPQLIQQYFHTY